MSNEETNTAANVAEQGANVAPEKGSAKKGASRKKDAPTGQRRAKGGKPKGGAPKTKKANPNAAKPAKAAKSAKPAKTAKPNGPARDGSKKAEVVELMRRKQGATLAEIMKLTGWQAHTVRGFISIAGKKQGLKIDSFRTDDKERTYRIK